MRDASTLEFFDSLQQIFQRAGYGTTILVSDNDPAKETAIVQQLVQQGVPGIVLFTAHEADSYAHLQAAQEAGVKVALFDHFFPEYPCNFVGIDDQLAGYEATAHLIHLGCSEMVLINSELNWTTHTRRERGFHDALRKHGATGSSRVVHLPMFHGTKERLREELALIERKPGEKIGFVVWNDQVALETIEALQELGWNLPDEAAIIGFADDQESSINNLSLSSMQIPREQIGQLLAYLLLDQLANPNNPPQHVAFNARLLIRESCGCYRMQKREASFLSR